MIDKAKLTLIAAIAASSIALPAAAFAQSAYTTGTLRSDASAGYPSPYGSGSGVYAYAPGHGFGRSVQGRSAQGLPDPDYNSVGHRYRKSGR
jgi:hypothetical protein